MEEASIALETRAYKKKYHFIYKTTCVITGRWYIGMHSTDNLEDGYLGSGRKLWRSIRKHGEESHVREILEFCESRDKLAAREKEIVNKQMLLDEQCMNLMVGGDGGWAGIKMDFTARNRKCSLRYVEKLKTDPDFALYISNTLKESYARVYKYSLFSDEANNKRKNTLKERYNGKRPWQVGSTRSEETKRKMSISGSGKNNSNYGKHNKCVSKDGITKRIPLDEVDNYLEDGWVLGIKKCKPMEE